MIAVSADRVGKQYRRYDAQRPTTWQEAFVSGFRHLRGGESFWSLREVSFEVERGRTLGVVGRNGAGKSTLLRLLGGISRPDAGTLSVRGHVGGLLELTAGFHPDLTGRENVMIGGVIRGLTCRAVASRLHDIVDFAELRHAIDRPTRTYSTGMQLRLAFAVAIHAEPEILLVDEVLTVGDAAFQAKCLERVARLRGAGCTVVLASHDASLVQRTCDQALWLREGEVADFGDAHHVVAAYARSQADATVARTRADSDEVVTSQGMVLVPGKNRFGSGEVAIVDVRVSASSGSPSEMTEGEGLSVELDYEVAAGVAQPPIFCITLVDDAGGDRLSVSTEQAGIAFPDAPARGHLSARLHCVDLGPGTYFVDVGAYEAHWAFAYDYHSRAYPLIVRRRVAPAAYDPAPVQRVEWVHNAREADGCAG